MIINAAPTCPHCAHVMTFKEMEDHEVYLFGLPFTEGEEDIECPACAEVYRVKGITLIRFESTKIK